MTDVTQLARLGLFEANVPRYTSYPPATRFGEGVDAATYRGWLEQIAPETRVSIYIHVPFCRKLCWFCACRTQGVRTPGPVADYVESLKEEIATLAAHLPAGVRVARLHWGGGTPTLLSPDQISDLMAALDRHLDLSADLDFSVEIDPAEIDAERLDALAATGMTRASIGVQDFDPRIQAAIGRIQGYELTRRAADMLRDRGVASLNADILYGLPLQTPRRIADSVQQLLSLSPDRVALYGYAHVPWMARRQRLIETADLPGREERLKLFQTAERLFAWDGYTPIGIDHFAKPDDALAQAASTGHLRRNFQGYTDDTCDALIGLGASSISRLPQGYAQNAPATAAYHREVRGGKLAVSRGHRFTGDDLVRARIIEALMCDFRVSRAEIVDLAKSTQTDPTLFDRLAGPVAETYAEIVVLTDEGLTILPRGRALTRMIARGFDAYEVAAGSHAPAI